MSAEYPIETGPSPERRQTQRFATERSVRFSDIEHAGPLRSGRVVEMSAGGMRVESASTLPEGTRIEIELPADSNAADGSSGGDPMLLTGRIAHVSALDSGGHVLGVATEFTVRGELPKKASTKRATAAIGERIVPRPLQSSAEAVTTQKTRWRRWVVAAALALFLLGLLSLRGPRDAAPVRADAGAGLLLASRAPVEPIVVTTSISDSSREGGALETPAPDSDAAALIEYERVEPEVAPPIALLSRAQAALAVGDDEAGLARLDTLLEDSGTGDLVRFIGRLERAQVSAARGERGLALKLLRDAVAHSDAIPKAWMTAANRELRAMESNGRHVPAFGPMDARLALAEESTEPKPGGFTIEVDASDFVLTVRRNGDTVAQFPVGLGRDGATPLGTFVVVDKIADPDWYNAGRSVPAGAPENPLGESWMGLGKDGRGTGIGIHPTGDGGSIAQPMSEGCVRMRPEDAEALFRLVPAGTRVRIHE